MEITSTTRQVCHRTQQPPGRRRTTRLPHLQRTATVPERGFLTFRFPSLWVGDGSLASPRATENAFTRSLQFFCAALDTPSITLTDLRYPQNIAEAFQRAEEIARSKGLELLLVKLPNKSLTLVTRKYCERFGNRLYFIPLKPIYCLLQTPRKAAALLLLSVAAYLYQAGVPHYSDGTIISEMCDYIKSSMDEMEDDAYREAVMMEFEDIKTNGSELFVMLRDNDLLDLFEQQLKELTGDPAEKAILKVAQRAFSLYRDYPGRRVQCSASKEDITHYLSYGDTEEMEANTIFWERYVSFCWSSTGKLFDCGEGYIDAVLEEYSVQEYPYVECVHNQPTPNLSLHVDFESRFMELMEDFVYLLNNVI